MGRPTRRSDSPAQSSEDEILLINGWLIYGHPLFLNQLEDLIAQVEQLKTASPREYQQKKKTKLLTAILKVAFEIISSNPADRRFFQGNTLGSSHRHWYRAKFFDGRFRLFFRYSSAAKVIVLAWVNDEETLRTYGSKTDAYAVFKTMLGKKRPPDDWDTLLKESLKETQMQKELIKRR